MPIQPSRPDDTSFESIRATAPKTTREAEFATLLRANAFFADLPPETLQHLAGLCGVVRVPAGGTLFQKGDAGDALYGVRRGQIRIEIGTGDGQRVTLNALGAGDVFGEIALLDGQPRTADAVAAEPTELFALRRETVLADMRREPKLAIHFIELLCRRLRYVSTQREESLTLPVSVRMARRLLALCEDFGCDIDITQDQLAAYVGATRESINRQLNVWRRAGHLAVRRGHILLQNLEPIRQEARLSLAEGSDAV